MTEQNVIYLENKPTLESLPIDLLYFMDDLDRFGRYLECLQLAIPEACSDLNDTNALQAFLALIQEKFENLKERVEYERQRQILLEKAGKRAN
ncbi:MAG TPA: hypothetical protein VM144_19215 [Aestuariivirga sp.]|nr:hypothetical protein [Aestuariivirga sp.]